jgi:hypothetical protein
VAALEAIIKDDIGMSANIPQRTGPHTKQSFTGDEKITRHDLAGQPA